MKTLPLFCTYAMVAPCVLVANEEEIARNADIICTARLIYQEGEQRLCKKDDTHYIEYSKKTLWQVDKGWKGCRSGEILLSTFSDVVATTEPWPNADGSPISTRYFPDEEMDVSELLLIDKAEFKNGVYHIGQLGDNYICLYSDTDFFKYYASPATETEQQLISAVLNNDLPKVKELLSAGVNPNTADMRDMESPLYLAIGEKSNAECDGTPLWTDYREGQTEMARALLAAGADPNVPSTMLLHTPLMEAARTADIELVTTLLQKGADIHAKSCTGMTALHFAAAEGSPETVKLLLDNGALPNLSTTDLGFLKLPESPQGVTPLHLAAEAGQTESVKLLLQSGAYVDTPDSNGNTPYFYAAMMEHSDCMKILQNAGADTQFRNKAGRTPEEEAQWYR